MAFAAGFAVRPFGAIVFGRLGDMVGRKHPFLITIAIMGISTFVVGLLPGYATIGVAAPIILISLRLLQGLALAANTAVRRPMWPNMRRKANAASYQLDSDHGNSWASSCRCW